MHTTLTLKILPLLAFSFFALTSCNSQPPNPSIENSTPQATVQVPLATATATPAPPPRVLTICTGVEPASLFHFRDLSPTAADVYAALYDGPIDVVDYTYRPVLLAKIPDRDQGDIELSIATVEAGSPIVDASGQLVTLGEGVVFYPADCTEQSCAQTYQGREAVSIGQLVVRFELLPGLTWSDGTPLTAQDSVFAYQVARGLFPQVWPERLTFTHAYSALDEHTLEWQGVPGYLSSQVVSNFFQPLPRHRYAQIAPQDLLTDGSANRSPIGWGAYTLAEWVAGDHISLDKNPNYFQATAGLPKFDHLVFRFTANYQEALDALLAGECDMASPAALENALPADLRPLAASGRLAFFHQAGTAWEHLDFNLSPVDSGQMQPFRSREVRQAIAMCIDREQLAATLSLGDGVISDSYLPPDHPLYLAESRRYSYDPAAGGELLTTAGWLDLDQNPQTPRTASGVANVPDGSPFEIPYLYLGGGGRDDAAQMVRNSLAQCGVSLILTPREASELFAPGPEGPIFGRSFQLAQFGWAASLEPPCYLYTSEEIAGPYPDYPRGWAGANATGYQNPAFDEACQAARRNLPGTQEYVDAHHQAQRIYSEDLPALPLYWHEVILATRPDVCGVTADASTASFLWDLERYDYGPGCEQ